MLWGRVRRGINNPDDARLAEEEFSRIAIALVASGDYVRQAFDLALELNHPIYDCLYLAVAITHGEPLVTADRRFFNAVASSRHAGRVVLLASYEQPHRQR